MKSANQNIKPLSPTRDPGFLVAVEGMDGSGKSTLAARLYHDLVSRGLPAYLTREPGDTEIGEKIRSIIHATRTRPTSCTEFLLFAADRAEHFSRIVLPELAKNKIVISDRLADSSVAYQGYGRGLDLTMINSVNRWAMQDRQPDLVIYVDISIEVAKQRLEESRLSLTSIEKEERHFWEKVRMGFQETFAKRNNVLTIDGTIDTITSSGKIVEQILKQFTAR